MGSAGFAPAVQRDSLGHPLAYLSCPPYPPAERRAVRLFTLVQQSYLCCSVVAAPVTPAWGFERDRESVVLSGYVLIQHVSFQVERCLPKEKAGACSYRP